MNRRVGNNGIAIEALAREYEGGVRAVDGSALQVDPGEVYGFLGRNGAGSRRRSSCSRYC
jgi:ABC-type multidrug transport system ATPase subunit